MTVLVADHSRQRRVNYYSNPAVLHPDTGTPTGLAGAADSAAVLRRRRFLLALVGDDHGNCQGNGRLCTWEPDRRWQMAGREKLLRMS